ncbi:RDD family protein [Mycobacterium sp. CBMA271]|uniref:RDD family protein n=1 Tax=unclassified Mycobacteroides TaxID=2618759 RepID=UPI001326F96D|nr:MULTISPECIES: RDD family protein [unclassified Mycobacteroides]MUM15676.1 hypothetical protein [Mycobacteroides sp. CBMA 326]MUM17471.1 hypothetical protein [Mycobacteroides sp. CBMA 326]MUM21948.1 RDD family protein [Mycobacteroides sp. CBMA 271]
MTEVPPPPPQDPGAYPPPPPAAGGGALPGSSFEIWIKRVGAVIVDAIIPVVLVLIGEWILFGTAEQTQISTSMYDQMDDMEYGSDMQTYSFTGLGIAVFAILTLGAIAFGLWNLKKQGDTGSTIGKNLLGIRVLGETTGQPIGFGMSFVRQLAHALDSAICGIGYLLPLFTAKRQTIADMLVKTVVVPK